MLTFVRRQALGDKVIAQRHIQNAVGFTQRLGVHFTGTIVRNIAVYRVVRVDIRIAHQQGTHFIAVGGVTGQAPEQA